MTTKENIYNFPNLLSFYRLVSVPALAYVAYIGKEQLFFYWFIFNMFTDALDGFIARNFDMKTHLGAKLDSIADFAMYLLAMYAMIQLKWEALLNVRISFFLIIFFYLFIDIFALIKFKEIASLHLYISKLNGLIQGLFFVILFTTGFHSGLYWLMFTLALLGFLENMYFLIKLDKMRSDLKGILWNRISVKNSG